MVTKETVASSLITIHNITFLMRLMSELRDAIAEGTLPAYVRKFLQDFFPLATPAPCKHCPPRWVKGALDSVGIATDDLFDWNDAANELADMPHHHSKEKCED
jgi:queuine tRNA-ribosyltransferase